MKEKNSITETYVVTLIKKETRKQAIDYLLFYVKKQNFGMVKIDCLVEHFSDPHAGEETTTSWWRPASKFLSM